MSVNGTPLRIGNMSGFYGDRISAMREMLEGGELDVLTGDYLAELTMLILGRDRMKSADLGYAKTFLRQLEDCLALALDKGVKIVANAGGVNPAALAGAIRDLADRQGLPARVAHVEGDDLIARIDELDIPSDAGFPVTANAYLGAFGIARCLDAGADIVVTGRVTDASVIVGPAISHFDWGRDDLDSLAGATAAGHVIECGTQATGGNYAFFNRGEIADPVRPGFPIAEIAADGTSVITKHAGTGGAVTVGTVLVGQRLGRHGQPGAQPVADRHVGQRGTHGGGQDEGDGDGRGGLGEGRPGQPHRAEEDALEGRAPLVVGDRGDSDLAAAVRGHRRPLRRTRRRHPPRHRRARAGGTRPRPDLRRRR